MNRSRLPGVLEKPVMLDVATSQLTTLRWDLARELSQLTAHGFTALAVWRSKLSDVGPAAAATSFAAAGIRASSLQWAGGFTGGDGRSFADGIGDAIEAIEAAATLGAAAPDSPPPAVVLHSGCRGGHTRAHATRLLHDALHALGPVAGREGVVLAIEPLHPGAASGCSFLAGLDEALEVVAAVGDPAVGIALDLWHFGDDPGLAARLPQLATTAVLVQVADRCGPPSRAADRLPAGHGTLPLEEVVAALVQHGYRGDFEFDPVGETVEVLGYEGVLGETRLVAEAWRSRVGHVAAETLVRVEPAHGGPPGGEAARAGLYRRAGAGTGVRRSQASSHTVSRG
jgi:sugar phosphate isomerase/epimerase